VRPRRAGRRGRERGARGACRSSSQTVGGLAGAPAWRPRQSRRLKHWTELGPTARARGAQTPVMAGGLRQSRCAEWCATPLECDNPARCRVIVNTATGIRTAGAGRRSGSLRAALAANSAFWTSASIAQDRSGPLGTVLDCPTTVPRSRLLVARISGDAWGGETSPLRLKRLRLGDFSSRRKQQPAGRLRRAAAATRKDSSHRVGSERRLRPFCLCTLLQCAASSDFWSFVEAGVWFIDRLYLDLH
jgi:hypothetical protein